MTVSATNAATAILSPWLSLAAAMGGDSLRPDLWRTAHAVRRDVQQICHTGRQMFGDRRENRRSRPRGARSIGPRVGLISIVRGPPAGVKRIRPGTGPRPIARP